MIRRFSLLFGLSLLVALLAASAFARPEKVEITKINSFMTKMTYYSFPRIDSRVDEGMAITNPSPSIGNRPRNTASLQSSVSAPSPGVVVGNTVYEYQSNGSNRRQVGVSNTGAEGAIVHFDWMYSPDAANAASATGKRTLRYNSYWGSTGDFMTGGAQDVSETDQRTGYIVGDVIPSLGEYLAVGHHFISAVLQPRGWWDQGPGQGFWVDNRITGAVADNPDPGVDGVAFAWPACAHQQYLGQTITHILAHESDDEQIKYFRKVGTRETGTWVVQDLDAGAGFQNPIDTANNLGYGIYASKTTGKVVIGWLANIPTTSCDTCTQDAAAFVQWDNDFLIKVSTDAGATWGVKRNITKNVDGVAGYRPYYDLSIMIDELDNVIASWPARQWPSNANQGGSVPIYRCRVQFWSETFAPGVIRTVAGLEWDPTDCDLGAFKLNAGRTQLARCNGRTYVLWEQGNDFSAGIMNDCAERAGIDGADDPAGAANSDLYVSVSEDGGLTWDPSRNITNTRTPGCDSATGAGGACQSEVYPTLTPFGHNYAGDFTYFGAQTPISLPGTAGSNNGYYLEAEYVLDPHAGGAIRPEGPWFLADVMWARIACDTSVKTPVFTGSYNSIGYPAWVKNGNFRDTAFRIENTGNQTLTYTVTPYAGTGPLGWLTTSGFSGTVPSGLGNVENGSIRLNATSSGTPGATAQYVGGVVFASNAPTSPDTVKITILVVDTLVTPMFDTIYVTSASKASNRKALAVSNNGGFGLGRIRTNLDFAVYGDCDTTLRRYLTDGSVVVAYPTGADTSAFYTFSEDGYTKETGLRPVKGNISPQQKTCATQNMSLIYSGKFTTADTNITMEKTWYAPILANTGSDDSAWFVQCLKVYNTSGAAITGLAVGEFADWDIPSDTGSDNVGGIAPLRNLVYLQGGEFDNDTNAQGDLDCQVMDSRFGGARYLGGHKQAGVTKTQYPNPAGEHVKEFSSEIGGDGLLNHDSLVLRMQLTGFVTTDSVTDNVMLMNFRKGESLGTTDTLRFYTAWLSVKNGDTTALFTMSDRAKDWFIAKKIDSLSDTACVPPAAPTSCCIRDGNANHTLSGAINTSDVVFLVKYLFQSGPVPPCLVEANANDTPNGAINTSDIVFLVKFLFQGGPHPPGPDPNWCD